MKKLLSADQNSNGVNIALLIARVGIAGLMLTHGVPKLLMLLSGGQIQFPPIMGMSPELSLGFAVFAEVFCTLFILAGLATRFAVVPLIITMLVALVFIHSSDPIAKQEPALHYVLVYLVLLFAGSGKYSVDRLLQRNNKKTINDSVKVGRSGFAIQ